MTQVKEDENSEEEINTSRGLIDKDLEKVHEQVVLGKVFLLQGTVVCDN